MSDRRATLEAVTEHLCEYDAIVDAFLAKSFTDRLLIVDVETGENLPPAAVELLHEHDLRGIDSLDDESAQIRSAVGDVGGATRHHFVDVQTRGSHQSDTVS
jgi:hypothetical protein